MIRNLTDEEFTIIVKNSHNISEICKKLGVLAIEGNYDLIKHEIKRLNLDTNHFSSRQLTKKKNNKTFTLEEILVKDSSYKSQYRLKEKLIKNNLLPYTCAICGCEPKWQGKDLVLILDHINGDHFDCRLQNLRFVCPNCNSQLDTHGGKNKKVKVDNTCDKCGKKITYGTKNHLCRECYEKEKFREIPSKETLQEYLKTMSYVQIGKLLNVTSNAIRRWCKKYGITLSVEQIKERKIKILNKNKKNGGQTWS